MWIGAALAVLVTIIIVIEFLVDSKINTAPPAANHLCRAVATPTAPTRKSWPTRRSIRRRREAAQKEKQRQFQELEKQLGIE